MNPAAVAVDRVEGRPGTKRGVGPSVVHAEHGPGRAKLKEGDQCDSKLKNRKAVIDYWGVWCRWRRIWIERRLKEVREGPDGPHGALKPQKGPLEYCLACVF